MRMLVFGLTLLLPLNAGAGSGWTRLSEEEMRPALADQTLHYSNAWQQFRASGRTLYNAGSDSWGYWRIDNGHYCSQWPPSDLWACYTVERRGDKLRFVGNGGEITEAEYAQ